jgi:hypothetical protein
MPLGRTSSFLITNFTGEAAMQLAVTCLTAGR